MQPRHVLLSLVLVGSIAAAVAQPGFDLPPAGVSGIALGRVEDVQRVDVLMSERARAKFRAPRASIAVVDREYVLTFNSDTPPETVTEVASKIKGSEFNLQLKLVGNHPQGWRGIVFKVPRGSAESTAQLLESLLVNPDVKVGEANQIVKMSRPVRPRRFVADTTAPKDTETPTTQDPAKEVPASPTEPVEKAPVAACVPLKGIDSSSITKVATPNWGLDRIDTREKGPLNKEYTYSTDGASANVFVVDTGVQFDHPEFKGRAFGVGDGGFDAFGGDGSDAHGHGTHCSGVVGGKTTGVAKAATIYSVRVLDQDGSGTISTLLDGLNFVANSNLTRRIASMSLGGGVAEALNEAAEAAVKAGVLVIVAAGNEASDACEVSPASAPSAITVGATNDKDTMATFSNYGKCVDIFAPGVQIYSSIPPSTYAAWSGTSMATPHVAGVAARLWGKGVCSTNTECAEAIRCLGTSGLVQGLDVDSPNLLLHAPAGL